MLALYIVLGLLALAALLLAADFLAKQVKEGIAVSPYHTFCDAVEPATKEPLYEQLYAGSGILTQGGDAQFHRIDYIPYSPEVATRRKKRG